MEIKFQAPIRKERREISLKSGNPPLANLDRVGAGVKSEQMRNCCGEKL